MTSRQLYLRLLGFVKPYRGIFTIAIVAMIVSGATDLVINRGLELLFQGIAAPVLPDYLYRIPFAFVAIFMVRGASSFVTDYCMAWVGNKVVCDLRDAMVRRLVRLPTPFFDATSTSALVSKITFDVTNVAQAATSVVTVTIQDSILVTLLLGRLLYLNWRLTLLTFIVAPAVGVIVKNINRRLRRTSSGLQDEMGELTRVVEESISGHRVVKVFGGQSYEIKRAGETANRVRLISVKQAVAAALGTPLTQTMVAFAVAPAIWLAIRDVRANLMTAAAFIVFITAILQMLPAIKRLTSISGTVQRGLAAAESVFALMDEATEADSGHGLTARAQGALRFEQVCLTYGQDGRSALHEVTLDIVPGETIALVGPSGGGKTSLVNLIPRFYAPTRGTIRLDGMLIQDIELVALRRNIALVSQDVVLFNDTLAANIAYGEKAGADLSAIREAARAANALDFIEAMPEGFNTLIGERGLRLSGGQRQRLAIARALLKDAPILILDEATSALDTESERVVQSALDRLMQGRTTLVIAHRLSTIENADRIVVLDRGRIVEVGNHKTLITQNGLYRRLHQMQFRDTAPTGNAQAQV